MALRAASRGRAPESTVLPPPAKVGRGKENPFQLCLPSYACIAGAGYAEEAQNGLQPFSPMSGTRRSIKAVYGRYSIPFWGIQMLIDTVSVTSGTATTFSMAFDDELEEFDCVVSAVGVVATSPLSSLADDDASAIGRGLVVVENVAAQLLTGFLPGHVYTWQSW
jgi:hypothetical protein